jgi:hypothetical protein
MGIIAASRLRASPVNPNLFIIKVDTTKSGSASDAFQFTGAEGDYDVVAKQNRVVVQTFSDLSDEETIIFSDGSGIYTLEVTPKVTNGFNRIQFNNSGDRLKMIDIIQWGTIEWSSFESAFFNCENMLVSAIDVPNLSNVTNMSGMFWYSKVANPYVSNWDVSQITTMKFMFEHSDFNNPLNDWDVSNVTDMERMFYFAESFDQPLNSWDLTSCTTTRMMFEETPFNQPLNNWDVSNVTRMQRMFRFATIFNQDLSGWCVSQIPLQQNNFDDKADSWVLPNSRPVWGTCP